MGNLYPRRAGAGTINPKAPHGEARDAESTTRVGAEAERTALRHLETQGLRLLERNYRQSFGEVDLIMLDTTTLVFIEVKYRRDEQWMPVTDAIHPKQQQRIIRASEHYLENAGHRIPTHQDCRFDAVLLVGELPRPRIEWIKHAFTAC